MILARRWLDDAGGVAEMVRGHGTLVHHVDVGAGDDIDLVVRADVEVDRLLAERLIK
jgi:hypothetical protein